MTASASRAPATRPTRPAIAGRSKTSSPTTSGSPQDDGIDRATYFERCWPAHETFAAFDFKRLHGLGDEVLVTYEAERTDGTRFRNTEVLTFAGDRLKLVEVYFGWNL